MSKAQFVERKTGVCMDFKDGNVQRYSMGWGKGEANDVGFMCFDGAR
jgi:hypothetical protein